VLIVESDVNTQANTLRNNLLADGAGAVDFFEAGGGTPTLAQLQQYQIVVPFTGFSTYFDPVTLGNISNATLGSCTFSPLCNGVTTLNSQFRENLTVSSGATLAATWSDGTPLIAYKGRAVGVAAYVGDRYGFSWSGQYAQVITNAGHWLVPPCSSPTPTPTPSVTATATP
jgi:hypothetical protein